MVLLIAVNSKYIHTMPSLYYLKKYCGGSNISVLNLNINVPLGYMVKKACAYNPDIIGFSCYVFNIEAVKKLADSLKKIYPHAKIVFGGPEASYDESLLGYCDNIIKGEGEEAFKEYIKAPSAFGKIICGKEIDMDSLPDIYGEEYLNLCKDKILYYESSRGCPFKCGYCMSSLTEKVRYKSLGRVFAEIAEIYGQGIKQIKFVDRTFNSSIKRAEEIFLHITENYNGKNINFHFEMAPELFSEKMFAILKNAKKGLIQFEIGVQSFNPQTLIAVNRKADTETVENNIKTLVFMQNIHIHTDLIAGLPLEGYGSFGNSFNRLYRLKPDCIQLGFLKVLKGSPLSAQAEKYGIKYSSFPPYEVLSTDSVTADELCSLKDIEELTEIYYNKGRFKSSMDCLEGLFPSPFEMFESMAKFLSLYGFFDRGISYESQTEYLYKFACSAGAQKDEFLKLLKSDFSGHNNNMNLMAFLKKA